MPKKKSDKKDIKETESKKGAASSSRKKTAKSEGKASARKSANSAAPSSSVEKEITLRAEDVSLRAYYISEERVRRGLDGSPEDDWYEAERQLLIEARQGGEG